MAAPVRKNVPKKSNGPRVVTLVILALIIASIAGYYLFSPTTKTAETVKKSDLAPIKPAVPAASLPKAPAVEQPVVPQPPHKEQKKYPPAAATPGSDRPVAAPGSPARLAIIIDDMGSSLSEARSLAAINVPLTFSIIPGLRADTQVAAFAASRSIETMIHIPMQSKGWPARRLEANGLLVAMDSEELRERVSGFVQHLPGAVGVNNHMGSEFTEHEEKMADVLQILKNNNLYFIDSVTSPESAGTRVAQRVGIKSGRRNVFLDNEQERNYILGQLGQAVRQARKNGSAIAICHPHSATIAALAAALPGVAAQGVRLVPASELVK